MRSIVLLVLGSTGSGKSTLCNFLASYGKETVFKTSSSMQGCTKKAQKYTFVIKIQLATMFTNFGNNNSHENSHDLIDSEETEEDVEVTLIDTPGLNENSHEEDFRNMIETFEFCRGVGLINGVVICIRHGSREDRQLQQTIQYYSDLYREVFDTNNIAIMITGFPKDDFRELKKVDQFEEFLSNVKVTTNKLLSVKSEFVEVINSKIPGDKLSQLLENFEESCQNANPVNKGSHNAKQPPKKDPKILGPPVRGPKSTDSSKKGKTNSPTPTQSSERRNSDTEIQEDEIKTISPELENNIYFRSLDVRYRLFQIMCSFSPITLSSSYFYLPANLDLKKEKSIEKLKTKRERLLKAFLNSKELKGKAKNQLEETQRIIIQTTDEINSLNEKILDLRRPRKTEQQYLGGEEISFASKKHTMSLPVPNCQFTYQVNIWNCSVQYIGVFQGYARFQIKKKILSLKKRNNKRWFAHIWLSYEGEELNKDLIIDCQNQLEHLRKVLEKHQDSIQRISETSKEVHGKYSKVRIALGQIETQILLMSKSSFSLEELDKVLRLINDIYEERAVSPPPKSDTSR